MQAPDTPCVKLAAVLQKQIEAGAVKRNTATVRVSLVEHANDIGLHQRVEIYRVCCLDCSDAGLLMGGLRSNR
jgi:hypothetical protein